MEKYLISYAQSLNISAHILRISNPYGEGQLLSREQGFIGMILKKALNNSVIEIWGDGSVIRDFIHVEDVAGAFLKAIEYQGDEQIFNVSSAQKTSLNDIMIAAHRLLQRPLNVKYLPSRSFDVPINILDNHKAINLMHWTPRIHLDEGINRTMRWMEQKTIKV